MPFERSCLYHKTQGMRVIEDTQEEEYKRLLESGVWFDHPTKAKNWSKEHEEPIRQRTRKRRSDAKHPSEEIRVGTLEQECVREEAAS
jgi:hypothetical protein